jgi:hypothetical protein
MRFALSACTDCVDESTAVLNVLKKISRINVPVAPALRAAYPGDHRVLKNNIRPSTTACGVLESAAYSAIGEHLQKPHNAGSQP